MSNKHANSAALLDLRFTSYNMIGVYIREIPGEWATFEVPLAANPPLLDR
jgi:hypothetical protein